MDVQIPEKVDDLVEMYIKLRDRIKQANDAHEERLKAAKELLERLNGTLLTKLNEVGGDGIRTPHGTAYRTERKSATLADPAVFRSFVIDHGQYDLADWKANATAVAAFIEENQSIPPGVNYTTTFTVGVRRK